MHDVAHMFTKPEPIFYKRAVYTHVYTHVRTHVYAHVYTHVRTHVYAHVYTQVRVRPVSIAGRRTMLRGTRLARCWQRRAKSHR